MTLKPKSALVLARRYTRSHEMEVRPPNDGLAWTRDQLVLALDLYCRIPWGSISWRNPRVKKLAAMIGRTPASVARKLGNFGAFDPALAERSVGGLPHGSKLDRQVWDEFQANWGGLAVEADSIGSVLALAPAPSRHERALLRPPGPSERMTTVKQRLHQAFFREAVLSSYDTRCCVTGLPVRECLVAGHIIPWSVDESRRADPTNGVCMSATFDCLFDCGLVTITEELTLLVSRAIRDSRDGPTADLITARDGQKIAHPSRFYPDPACLRWHHEHVFRAA